MLNCPRVATCGLLFNIPAILALMHPVFTRFLHPEHAPELPSVVTTKVTLQPLSPVVTGGAGSVREACGPVVSHGGGGCLRCLYLV